MFLKQLRIENDTGIIRDIKFRKGLNLIVDDTPVKDKKIAGNNIGKTTVLRLIDFCFGSDGKNIYTGTEFKEQDNTVIKDFLIDTGVLVSLTLGDDLESPSDEIVIERNFLSRGKKIQKINGESITNKNEFDQKLKKLIFKSNVEKPTFRQIISKNIRDENEKLANIVKVLSPYTTIEEYEALYLFWLGIDTNLHSQKDNLAKEKTREETFQKRLRKEGELSLIEQRLAHTNAKIEELVQTKDSFYFNEEFETQVEELNLVKAKLSGLSAEYSRLSMRKELILESRADLEDERAGINVKRIEQLYKKASRLIPDLQVSFEETVVFHNDLIKEKIKYIEKELPEIEGRLKSISTDVNKLRTTEKDLSEMIRRSELSEEYEKVLTALNNNFELKGNLEEGKKIWVTSNDKLNRINEELDAINSEIYSKDTLIQKRIILFNKHFTKISNLLYGEEFLLSSLKNDRGYELVVTDIEGNPSTGKKKGQIAAFDFAYILFAEELDIEFVHFIMHDQLENVHDNQLSTILFTLANSINCQFVLPILKDKIPDDLNIDEFIILELNENNRLFKVD